MGMKPLKKGSVKNWFAKFCSVDFSLKNALRSSHPVEGPRPFSIQIIIAQHVRLQRSSMNRVHALKKKIKTKNMSKNLIYGSLINLWKYI